MALVLSILVQHVPTCSLLVYVENLYVKFSYPHMRNEECNYWELSGPRDERTVFSSTWMCDSWWSNCWPFCHPCPHSPYVGYNVTVCGFIAFPPPLQKLPSAGELWIFVNMQMSLLSHHSIAVKSALVLTRMSPVFSFVVFGARSCGMPLLFGLTLPQQ